MPKDTHTCIFHVKDLGGDRGFLIIINDHVYSYVFQTVFIVDVAINCQLDLQRELQSYLILSSSECLPYWDSMTNLVCWLHHYLGLVVTLMQCPL